MTYSQAKIIVLERQLDQAAHTINFLHECLTNNRFSYEFPDQTIVTLDRIRDLVPARILCMHSKRTVGCDGCFESQMLQDIYTEAERKLNV